MSSKTSKKRKRDGNKDNVDEELVKPTSKVSRLFKGVVFGISANLKTQNDDDENELTYNELKAKIENAGGSVSGIVHKKVKILIASERAVEEQTQRVRKAIKFKIPIVSLDYLDQCLAKKQFLSTKEFEVSTQVLQEKQLQRELQKQASKKSETIEFLPDDTELSEDIKPIVVDLGCCCSCHDSGKPLCSWCEPHHEHPNESKNGTTASSPGRKENSGEDGSDSSDSKREKPKKKSKSSKKTRKKRKLGSS